MHDAHKFMTMLMPHPVTGLTFPETMALPYSEFEKQHTTIQWLFPTMEASNCQPENTPVLEWNDVLEMQADPDYITAQNIARQYMEAFYKDMQKVWVCQYDHNHLRITRIIQSLSLFQSQQVATSFSHIINKMNAEKGYKVNMKSVDFWVNARTYGPEKKAFFKS